MVRIRLKPVPSAIPTAEKAVRPAGRVPRSLLAVQPRPTGPVGPRPAGLAGPRRRRGSTAAEFALVAVPTTLMMYGIMETAWQVATLAALDHATLRVARFGTTGLEKPPYRTGAPNCRSANIAWFASQVTGGFLKPANLTVTTNTFDNYNNSTTNTGGSTGPGAGGKVVTYTLTYTRPWLVGGLVKLATGATSMTYRSTLTIKNEPFDNAVC
jgi:Flp pilus assembly protein TadG